MVAEAVREALQAAAVPAPAAAVQATASEDDDMELPQLLPVQSPGTSVSPGGLGSSEHLGDSVASHLRLRIVENRYVALGALLDTTERPPKGEGQSFQIIDGLLRPASRAPRTISSFGTWCLAFLRFAGVYLEAHPDAAAGLMTHMRQVGQLTAPGLGFAWREFDEAFRRAREAAPVRHPWGETASSSPMWLQAVARGIGGAARQYPSHAHQSTTTPFRVCFAYNLPRGCTTRPCRFTHACRRCRGPHPLLRCPARHARPHPGAARSRAAPAGPAH